MPPGGRRAVFRRAALRWHPDKFEQRWRARLTAGGSGGGGGGRGGGDAADRWPALLARVQGVAQAINDEWAQLSAQQRAAADA